MFVERVYSLTPVVAMRLALKAALKEPLSRPGDCQRVHGELFKMARLRRSRGWFFRTKQPHHYTWLLALILAVLGVVGAEAHIDFVSRYAFWFVVAAYVALALGTVIDGL